MADQCLYDATASDPVKSHELKKLVFVYNAHSGYGNSLLGSAHKMISPSTYECRLCSLTSGMLRDRAEWKRFREEGTIPMSFLHKDEFRTAYASKFGAKYTFPIVLAETGGELEVLVNTAELNAIEDTGRLIGLIRSRLRS